MEDPKILNLKLLEACTAKTVDIIYIEELLKAGANPLGYVEKGYDKDILYSLVLEHFLDSYDIDDDQEISYEINDGELVPITEMFIKYGMDILNPEKAYDCDNDITNPMWVFSYLHSEASMQSLTLLLDNGLDADSTVGCWGHDLQSLHFADIEVEDGGRDEIAEECFKKLMLIASYPHVINNQESLQKEIWYSENDYDITNFRRWNDFEYIIEPTDKNFLNRAIVRIIEKSTQKEVWTFGFEISPDEAKNL